FEENVAGVMRATLEGRILEANDAAARMFGYERARDMAGLSAEDVYAHPRDRQAFLEDLEREGRVAGQAHMGRRADGSTIPILASSVLIENPETGRDEVVATILDLTERVRMEQALQVSEERYRRIFEDSNDAIYVTDRDGAIVEVNPAFERLFGYLRAEVLDMNAADFYRDERDRERFQHIIERSGHVEEFEVGLQAADGRPLECMLSATVRTDDRGKVVGYQGMIRDVSERKLFEEELERRALHDPLTGLPNRTLFFDRLEQAVARTRRGGDRIAVAFLDLDRFKAVNDSLGHSAGDHVLAEVARRLQGAVRASDTVARMGGDEFTVLLEGLEDEEEAVEAAARIGRSLHVPVAAGGEEVHLTVSVGLAHAGGPEAVEESGPEAADGSRRAGPPDVPAPSGPVTAGELVRRADAAMFRAKDLRGTHVQAYDPGLDAAQTARIQRENELRGALERGEFLLHYQPIVALESGRIVAVEPLVRWRHPEHGLLAPGEFLPLAEESGLILPLGAWVLRRALKQVTAWREAAADAPLVLSVNLSPAQFEDPGLVPLVESLLEEFRVPPRLLQLEVTEHTMMRTPDRARQLSRLGVGIVIDDFGTGYSSLRYVRELEADALKIDRSFVTGLGRDARDEAIVTTILALGRSLDLDVVAEGVETDEQMRWLRAAGCPAAQGFHLARPVPPEELEALLARGIDVGGGGV
ncbi:MAG TPA: EAL domain-containing protein, partial [Gemmatimonadota bacterium]|nr:EAL domain-containing protein [Gemmatimonadota bacterium]